MWEPPTLTHISLSHPSNPLNSNPLSPFLSQTDKDNSSRFGAPTSLSDISEDKERYFRQQERRRDRPTAGVGHRITQMCDSIADGISETMSRFFNSAKLFFKTCFWSGSGRRKD